MSVKIFASGRGAEAAGEIGYSAIQAQGGQEDTCGPEYLSSIENLPPGTQFFIDGLAQEGPAASLNIQPPSPEI